MRDRVGMGVGARDCGRGDEDENHSMANYTAANHSMTSYSTGRQLGKSIARYSKDSKASPIDQVELAQLFWSVPAHRTEFQ